MPVKLLNQHFGERLGKCEIGSPPEQEREISPSKPAYNLYQFLNLCAE